MTAAILQKMDQRRLAKGNEALYNLLDREIRQECKAANENMLASQCDMIEQLDAAHKSNLMHSQIRSVTGRKRENNPTTCIEDNEGNNTSGCQASLRLPGSPDYTDTVRLMEQTDGRCPGTQLSRGERPRLK